MTPENRLVFGQRPERRNLQPTAENQSILGVYRLTPLMGEAIIASEEERQFLQAQKKQRRQQIIERRYGKVESDFSFSPATISKCLRWAGYDLLGYRPLPKTPREIMILSTGTSTHWKILGALERFGKIEYPMVIDEDQIEGHLDFRFQNPKTKEYQIADLKTTSKEGFGMISREGMPTWMSITEKDFYVPRPEDRLQVLLYMLAERRKGYDVAVGNVIYINRNYNRRRLSSRNLEEDLILQDMKEWTKECLVLWDEMAESEVKQFLLEAEEAWIAIKKGELPKPSVHPKSAPFLCGEADPHRLDCEFGHPLVARQLRRKAKRLSREAWAIARKQFAQRKEEGIELGVVQPELPGLEEDSVSHCGCGAPMVWDKKAARGGAFVCKNPGCSRD